MLKLNFPVEIDESIESYQYIEKDIDQSNTSLNNSGELTITFQNQDAWLYPSDSYLRVEGEIKAHDNAVLGYKKAVGFVNNGILQLFTNARYFFIMVKTLLLKFCVYSILYFCFCQQF